MDEWHVLLAVVLIALSALFCGMAWLNRRLLQQNRKLLGEIKRPRQAVPHG